MSALRIEKKLRTGNPCSAGCQTQGHGPRVAVAYVSVAGWPVPGEKRRTGWFCARCCQTMIAAWDSALPVPVEVQAVAA